MNRVLLINDSRFESIVLNDVLTQIGYHVVITDEYHAMDYIETFEPDIVLANYIMQDIKGDKLISLIKRKNRKIKCYLTSSNQLKLSDIQNPDVDAIIKTPVNKSQLEAILQLSVGSERMDKAHIEEDKLADEMKLKLQGWKQKLVTTEEPALMQQPTPLVQTQQEAILDNKIENVSYHFCPFCGNNLKENNGVYAFCPFCGHKL